MKKKAQKQYTIRNVPPHVDQVLRRKAKESGKSFNQTALEAIVLGSGAKVRPERDFGGIIGSMSEKEARELDKEVRHQRQINPKSWK